jgi:pyruvate dehydrogenase (quinone)
MSETVGDFIIQRLHQWNIRRIYGYPGDGINGLMGALDRAGDKFEYVRARHEEMTAFMACAHAKFTGELGVCMATSGPGAIHLLNGLYDAKLDHQPVLAIVGQAVRASLGGHFQQEVELTALFKDVASEYVQMIVAPEQARHVIDRAVRIARAERTVTCVIVPNDVQELDAVASPPRVHGSIYSGIGYSDPVVVPTAADLQRAADVLNAGEKVALLVGAGALQATDEVIEVAELLGAGVAKALLGKASVPDDLPFVTGSIGILGTKPSWNMMNDCDTLFMIGSRFPYCEFLPKDGSVRAVQIDRDPRMLSIRYPMDVNLTGDSALTLRALIPLLERKNKRGWREKIENDVAEWWHVLESRAMHDADPVNPQRVFWELSPRLPDGCIIASDSGSGTNWFARDVKMRRGMMASVSGNLATMGCAVPYAIAAKLAHPNRPVLAIAGDGAMQMNGLAELITIADYWRRWSDPRLVILVLNNRDLNLVTWEQRTLAGDPKFDAAQHVPDFPYARFAEMVGLRGMRIDRPGDLAAAWETAFLAEQPVLIEVIVDPDVPPLPPHITLEQAKKFAMSLPHDSDRKGVIKETLRETMATLLPGKSR